MRTIRVKAILATMLFAITWNSIRLINSSHADLLEQSIDAETKLLANSLAPGLAVNDRAILEDVLSLLEEKPEPVELILTGRYCPPELIEKADLVTEMQEIKHYYQEGVAARKGIES